MSCNKNNLALTYDDILLVPQYSEITSRNQVDLKNSLGFHPTLEYPIISAPMDTVTGFEMAVEMSRLGGLGIIHRYNSIEEQSSIVFEVKKLGAGFTVGAAIGVTGDYLERAEELVKCGVDVLCIDIAHGHHMNMKDALKAVKSAFPAIHVMAGNIATGTGYEDLTEWGADSVKVGIGNGSICSTRLHTGHGFPSVSALLECKQRASFRRKVGRHTAKIIADGGIKNSGDIVKAIASGADFVMLGSLLAGTKEAPGELITTVEGTRKVYRGMASREAQNDWRGKSSAPEGISTTIAYKGELEPIFSDLVGGIKSGFSYSGARNMSEFQEKALMVQETSAGQYESWTHILGKK